MTSWMKKMQNELGNVTDEQVSFAEPIAESNEYCNVVGVVDMDLRKLFFLRMQYQQRISEIEITLLLCSKKEHEEKAKEILDLEFQFRVINDIFLISCQHAFPEIKDKHIIGVVKGWKLIWINPKDYSLDILGMVLHDLFEHVLFEMFEDDINGNWNISSQSIH